MSYIKHEFESGGTIYAADFNDIEDQIAANEADIEIYKAAIATDYDELTFPVARNSYCWYQDNLYRAKQDINSSESWTEDHWAAVTVGGELNTLLGKKVSKWNELTPYLDLAETESTRSGFICANNNNKLSFSQYSASGARYVCRIFTLEAEKTYRIFGFGYDRGGFFLASAGTSSYYELDGSAAATAPTAIENILCGEDAKDESGNTVPNWQDYFTYHTVYYTPSSPCYLHVNYKFGDGIAKVYEEEIVDNNEENQGGSSGTGGGSTSLARGVCIHTEIASGVSTTYYDCFKKDGDTYIIRRFNRRGPNKLFQWAGTYLGDVDPNFGVNDLSTVASFATDIVGPLSIYNTTLFPGQYGKWTGGNHSVTVNDTSYATAEQHKMVCLVNGEAKTEEGIFYGDVRFITENYLYFPQSISGDDLTSATKAVTERREYFLSDQMKVRVRLYFHENMRVATYYGMQAVTRGFEDIMFANNEYYTKLADVESGISLNKEERCIMMSAPNGLHFDMELSPMGLGSYNHLPSGDSVAHIALPQQVNSGKNEKVYYYLMSNSDIVQSTYLTWEGTYSLYFLDPDFYTITYTGLEDGDGGYAVVVTSDDGDIIKSGNEYHATLVVGSTYYISDVTITMGETDISNAYDSSTNKIDIASVTGNVTVAITALSRIY